MHENEQEWCADSWHRNYLDAPTNSIDWISSNSNEYVMRGMKSSAKSCRSAARENSVKVDFYRNQPIYTPDSAGFRVVCC